MTRTAPRTDAPVLAVLVALPGLALAVAGLAHPHHLSYETARWWFGLHLVGLPVFPLVGLALARLVRGDGDPLAVLVRVSAYLYACFYTALDVVSGLAAGWVTREIGPGVPRPREVSLLFGVGTPLGRVGEAALGVAALAVVVRLALRGSRAWLAAVALLPGAWLVHTDHIFAPRGVLGTALLGLGSAAVVLLGGLTHDPAPGAGATRPARGDATDPG